MRSNKLMELTWREVDQLDRANTLAIVPTGALEQHGFHMPLGTDAYVAEAVAQAAMDRLAGKLDFVVLPTLPLGQSPEHMEYAGTISLSAQTYLQVISDICSSLAKHGFKKIVFLNGHGGNNGMLEAASFQVRLDYDVRMFVINVWSILTRPEGKAQINREARDETDLHAGEMETSMVLAIDPDLVLEAEAEDDISENYARGKLVTFSGPVLLGWSSLDVTPSGASGEPSKASVEKGEQLMSYLTNILCEAIEEIAENW
jgi:creatinine amidohydrolase